MASHGGTISIKANELARTCVSGPIGGMVGAKYLAEQLGLKNVACSDIGGTSFDIGLITQGELAINASPDMARLVLSLPLVSMDTTGRVQEASFELILTMEILRSDLIVQDLVLVYVIRMEDLIRLRFQIVTSFLVLSIQIISLVV